MTAAKGLQHLGRSVIVLEATSRIGGRAYTGYVNLSKMDHVPIDLGGAWIHGVPTNPLTGIVDAMGYTRTRTVLEGGYYLGKKPANDTQLELFDEANTAFEDSALLASAREKSEQSMLVYLCDDTNHKKHCRTALKKIILTQDNPISHLPTNKKYRRVLDLVKDNMGPLEDGAELDKTSVVDTIDFATGEDDILNEGIGNFVQKYGDNLPVCLSSPVEKISYNEKGVEVQVKGAQFFMEMMH